MVNSSWWPFSLSPRLQASFNQFKLEMEHALEIPDRQQANLISSRLADIMACYVPNIIERDGLPYLCHIINGWGNATYGQRCMMDEMLPFVHRDEQDQPFILQCEPEGDFHPWQSFAYAIMAGVDPDYSIAGSGVTLRRLAQNSRHLNISKAQGHELGHLLYALSHLEPNKHIKPFLIGDELCDLDAIIELAIDAHNFGSFEVCRKVHLTEGLCSVVAKIPAYEHYRPIAENFLKGQLDILFLLCIALRESKQLLDKGVAPAEDSLLKELRTELKISGFLENHAFYVGHLVELAALATQSGFPISKAHWNAIHYAVNLLNTMIPVYLPYIYFEECFLHFGHYRRAITLLQEIDFSSGSANGEEMDLSKYTVDLDKLTPFETQPSLSSQLSDIERSVFKLARPINQERPRFSAVLTHYAKNARKELEPRGRFKHFRRVGPPSWPRAFHYEFLDYGDKIGIEVHIESDAVQVMNETVHEVTPKVKILFPQQQVQWDANWSRNRGRLQILFDEASPEHQLSAAMDSLINETFETFNTVASRLRIAR
jgi:hypothetical protein